MHASVQIFHAKNILGMTDQPTQNESNAPLPWNEAEDTTIEIGEPHDEEH